MHVELIAITPDCERVIERAGRTCYQSGSRIGPGSEAGFIRMVIENGHHSVLEHPSATFRITGVSRSFTHQLVRHRLCAFSQRSQRYVDEKNFRGLMLIGTVDILQDIESRRMLWSEGAEVYYPLGVEDPDYSVLRFTARRGNYYHGLNNITFDIE